ncbi:lactate 2-monooxygenase [Halobacterium wangiae]|uniref:lactate 2-monooxygenase n=1 Tax=Halobacterium wangiae TaxID=2902623 RepID=UPI001E3BDAAD|nr:lactate 2-monooxygenase [Halobacterium wangiae]
MADDGTPDQPGPSRQVDVYMQGMAGITPDLPVGFEELEARALETLDEDAYGYVAGAAGAERTKRANDAAFEAYRLVPRMLRDVGERDLSVELFGDSYDAPVLLAPIGVQSILHEDGERGTARAAKELGLPLVVSSASDTTLEELAEELGDAPKWFQLYWSADQDVADSFVSRAEEAGYDALVVTLDTPLLSWRERDVDGAYLPFLDGEGIANYLDDPAFRDRLSTPPEENELVAIKEFVDVFGNPSLTWDDLAGLCEQTDLPVVPKGVLHPDDARAAVDAGADSVVVSNHGGRQVDNAVPALEMLPEVVAAVGDEVPVLFDSGIRRGADVLVALALGADAVLFGRPYAYGLALEGADGVEEVCANLLADLDLTLGLCGLDDVAAVDRSLLRERN